MNPRSLSPEWIPSPLAVLSITASVLAKLNGTCLGRAVVPEVKRMIALSSSVSSGAGASSLLIPSDVITALAPSSRR